MLARRVADGLAWLVLIWAPALALLALIGGPGLFLLGALSAYHLCLGHILIGLGGTAYAAGALISASALTLILAYLVGGAKRKLLAALLTLLIPPALLLTGLITLALMAAAPGL